MGVNSRVTIHQQRIKQLCNAQIKALQQTAEALHTEVVQAQVVPRGDTGNLQNESYFVDDTQSSKGVISLVHDTPYARRMYYHPEYQFRTANNPNAKGKWYEDWLPSGKNADFVTKTYKELYKRLGGV